MLIEVQGLSKRYRPRGPMVVEEISFTIDRGETLAIFGDSGSGKSTITKLLLKYYEPEEGEIDFNGVNLAEYTHDSVRRAIAYVPQNIELFSKTIYDNIRISRMDATMEEVKEAAKKADAHEFIRHLPLQYNTYLEEAGNGLSGGEKQRIALARAFLKDSGLQHDLRAAGRPVHADRSSPPVHRSRLRPDPCDGSRQDRGARHPRRADGQGWQVC